MRKETIITAIVAVLVAIFDLLRVFGIVVPIEDATVYSVVSVIVAAVIYWRNQDWTDVMRISTAKGRAAKKAAKNGDLTLYDQLKGDGEYDN